MNVVLENVRYSGIINIELYVSFYGKPILKVGPTLCSYLIDVRVTNLDSKFYKNLPPKKALERKEKEKKNCKPCENHLRHFTPFAVSTDGMFGFEARAFLKRLAKLLAEKWEKPYPTVRGFINARMSIALVRATNRCIRGSRIPASNMSNRFRWEEGAGLGHLKSDN